MAFKRQKNTEAKTKSGKIGKDLNFASLEAYNLLRTNLSFALPDSEGGKTIGVTSPCPQDGKSTTSVNLAYSLADAGNKVLLIDADMRRPSLAGELKMPISPGLSNLLIDDSITEAIHVGVLNDNLSVIFAGDIPPNPSELIGSAKMKNLLESFRSSYDYVIVDLPPVNAVSDPIAVSKYLSGMILVVRHGHTKRREIAEAIRQLELVDAKLLGFVYNGNVKSKPHYLKF